MNVVSPASRFAQCEWERRFLLARFPAGAPVLRIRQISDRYIVGTRLRLRRIIHPDGTIDFKLTQKLNDEANGPLQGYLTTIYLSEEDYNVLSALPARPLEKVRHSVTPFGIDVFKGELEGLVMAEAEFRSAKEAAALEIPGFLIREVTSDPRFTGGYLAATTKQQLAENLAEFGLTLIAL